MVQRARRKWKEGRGEDSPHKMTFGELPGYGEFGPITRRTNPYDFAVFDRRSRGNVVGRHYSTTGR
jgi:hypothetical protein